MSAIFGTKQSAPEYANNGKWRAAFENYVTRDGETYMSSTVTSAPVFDTPADADEGGKRALAVLEATGKFPNMCEKF
jgi:hypothetical protein